MSIFNKKFLAVAAGLALSGASALASHVPGGFGFNAEQFNVNPMAVGENFAPFVAGSITFDYRGLVNQFGGAAGPPATAMFTEVGSAKFASFFDVTGGNPLPSGQTGLNFGFPTPTDGYKLYATFTAAGTVQNNGAGGIDGLFNAFDVQFFVDRNNNTTFANSGSTAPGGIVADDVLVLTGNLQVGGFHVFGGLANGDFDARFNVTSFGAAPFFSTTVDGLPLTQGDFNGVNTSVSGVSPAPNSFTNGQIIGSGNVTFQSVPEPTSLALVGLALAGIGLARKKKSA